MDLPQHVTVDKSRKEQPTCTSASTDSIFLVTEDIESGEFLCIMKLDPLQSNVSVVGKIQFALNPVVVPCNRSIFVLGGMHTEYCGPDDGRVQAYNPFLKTINQAAYLVEPVYFPSSTASRHEIILSGGLTKEGTWIGSCHLYNPATNIWTALPTLIEARYSHRMCWLPDGHVFAIGGCYSSSFSPAFLSSVETLERAWDTIPTDSSESVAGKWRQVAAMHTARSTFGCTNVNRAIVVAGGCTSIGNPTLSVEMFMPPTSNSTTDVGQWTTLQDLAMPIKESFLVSSDSELILIDGLGNMQRGKRNIQAFDATVDEWIWEFCGKLKSVDGCVGMVAMSSTV